MEEAVIIGARIIKGSVHCAYCGQHVNGSVYVDTPIGSHFVCNVQCGLNDICKRQEKAKP